MSGKRRHGPAPTVEQIQSDIITQVGDFSPTVTTHVTKLLQLFKSNKAFFHV